METIKRHKLQTTPKCLSCSTSTKFFTNTKNTCAGFDFIAEWYECPRCGRKQGRVGKILGESRGQIFNMVARNIPIGR